MSDINKNKNIAYALSQAIINFHPYTSINNEYSATDIVKRLDSIPKKAINIQTRIILADLEDAFNSKVIWKYIKSLFTNQIEFSHRHSNKKDIYKIKFIYLNTDGYSERSLKSLILEIFFTIIEPQVEEVEDTENQIILVILIKSDLNIYEMNNLFTILIQYKDDVD